MNHNGTNGTGQNSRRESIAHARKAYRSEKRHTANALCDGDLSDAIHHAKCANAAFADLTRLTLEAVCDANARLEKARAMILESQTVMPTRFSIPVNVASEDEETMALNAIADAELNP